MDNKAALSCALSRVMDEGIHHFSDGRLCRRSATSSQRSVYCCLLSLSSDKKLSRVVEKLCSFTEEEGARLMKMAFWPTYNVVSGTALSLRLHLRDDIKVFDHVFQRFCQRRHSKGLDQSCHVHYVGLTATQPPHSPAGFCRRTSLV